jgi:hypothetical protein
MRTRWIRPALLALAVVLPLGAWLLTGTAAAGDAGAWRSLSGPTQDGAAMAFDEARHRLLIWGGDGTDLVRALPLDGFPYSWTTLTTAGPTPPLRHGHVLVYDPTGDRLLMYGGETTIDGATERSNDLWQLSLSGTPTWTELHPEDVLPELRSECGAVCDPVTNRLYLFGGRDYYGNLTDPDLFVLDLAADPLIWQAVAVSGDVPPARCASQLALDPYGRRLLLFGGNDANGEDLADEYEFDLTTATWSTGPMTGDVPGPRSSHVCVYDRNAQQLLVWGGTANDDELRAFDPASRVWSLRNWFIGPPQHGGRPSVGVYDWQWDRLMVLAGPRGADVYQYFKSEPTGFWYLTGPTTLTFGGSMVVDRDRSRAIVYGGVDAAVQESRRDYWQFAFTDPIGWGGVNTAGIFPPARAGHVAVWDELRHRMLVLGGRDGTLAPMNPVYALTDSADFMNWSALTPGGPEPSPRQYASGVYDPVGDRVLMFGGLNGAGFVNQLWQLTLSPTPVWSQVTTTGGPSGRGAASAVYDPDGHRMLLFGGNDNSYRNDVWALNLPSLTWTQLAPTGTAPAGRWKHVAAYDTRRHRLLVFGGRVASADSADIWELDLSTSPPAWHRLQPTGWAPQMRSEAMGGYDPVGDRLLVYGGVTLLNPQLAIAQEDLWALQFSGAASAVESPTALADDARDPHLTVSPNPFNGRALFELAAPEGQGSVPASLTLYDLRGCRVARLFAGALSSGESRTVGWEGLDERGSPVASGVYLARAVVGGRIATTRIAVVR